MMLLVPGGHWKKKLEQHPESARSTHATTDTFSYNWKFETEFTWSYVCPFLFQLFPSKRVQCSFPVSACIYLWLAWRISGIIACRICVYVLGVPNRRQSTQKKMLAAELRLTNAVRSYDILTYIWMLWLYSVMHSKIIACNACLFCAVRTHCSNLPMHCTPPHARTHVSSSYTRTRRKPSVYIT